MRVAIIHDWLVSQRGGENVLDAVCELFPQADLFTLVHEPGTVSANIASRRIQTSFLQKLPQAARRYRHFLPLMPAAIERFDLSGYDLVLSSSHCVAKGVRKSPGAFHMSYVHAPMRYMWDRFDEYFSAGRYGLATRVAAQIFRGRLQRWDRRSARGVDHFLANSRFIAARVKQYYGREAQVVYPFCDFSDLTRPRRPNEHYLMVTALVPYKRVDLAIEAFNKLGRPLTIVGDGPDLARLKAIAQSHVEFVGALPREQIAHYYSTCKALVFPGVEDFGIVPLEAMAAGAPVIAFGAGGVLETVTEETGVFFRENSIEGLMAAIELFEGKSFDPEACRRRGQEFTRSRFQRHYLDQLISVVPPRLRAELLGDSCGKDEKTANSPMPNREGG